VQAENSIGYITLNIICVTELVKYTEQCVERIRAGRRIRGA
jgi:hypothetical protein